MSAGPADGEHAPGAGWRGTPALLRGALAGGGLVAAGVVMHRIDLVVVGLPLLLATALALAVPVRGRPAVTVVRPTRPGVAGERTATVLSFDDAVGTELVAVRAPAVGENSIGDVHLLPGGTRTLRVPLRRDRWGDGLDLRPDHLVAGRDALFVRGPVTGRELRRTLLPPAASLQAGPLAPRTSGLVGVHRAPRPGDGAELRSIRPFRSGDRVRHVDWRASLRAGAGQEELLAPDTLHVREHHAEADAELVFVLDERRDVDADVTGWASPEPGPPVRAGGSVDIAVRGITSLAAAFLQQGDRVGLAVLGLPQLGLAPAGGHRQFEQLRGRLVRTAQLAGRGGDPFMSDRRLPAGAVVVLFSPLFDDPVVELAVHTARSGHPVVAVDLFPERLVADPQARWGEVVCAMLAAEHRVRLRALREHGVTVIGWGGDIGEVGGEVAAVLRRLRRRAAPRVRP